MKELGLVQDDLTSIFEAIHIRLKRKVQNVALDRPHDIKAYVTVLLLIKIQALSIKALTAKLDEINDDEQSLSVRINVLLNKIQTQSKNPEQSLAELVEALNLAPEEIEQSSDDLMPLKERAVQAIIRLRKLNELKNQFEGDTQIASEDFFEKKLKPELQNAGLEMVSNGNNLVLKIPGNNIADYDSNHCILKVGYHFSDNLLALERLNKQVGLKQEYQLTEVISKSDVLANDMVLSVSFSQVGTSINQVREKISPKSRVKFVKQAGLALSKLFDDLWANGLLWSDAKAGNLIFKSSRSQDTLCYNLAICDTKGLLRVEDVQGFHFTDIALVPVGFEKSKQPSTPDEFNTFYYTQALGNMLFKFATGSNLENIPDITGDTEDWVKDQCIKLVRSLLLDKKVALQSHPKLIQWLSKPKLAEAVLSMLRKEFPLQEWTTVSFVCEELQKQTFHFQMSNNRIFQTKEGRDLAVVINGLASPDKHPKDRLSRIEAMKLLSKIGQRPKSAAVMQFFSKSAQTLKEALPVTKLPQSEFNSISQGN